MDKTLTESIYNLANQIVERNFEYSNASQNEIDAYRDGLIRGMEEIYEIISIANEDFVKTRLKMASEVHPWTIQDAKDGDVIFYDDGWTCIFKCIHGIWYSSYCFITCDGEFYPGYERHAVDATVNGNAHLATKEQCNRLFQKMKEAGYRWNPKTKTLTKTLEKC